MTSEIFPRDRGGGEKLSEEMELPFLGSVPLDPVLARACDEGQDVLSTMADSPTLAAISAIVDREFGIFKINSDYLPTTSLVSVTVFYFPGILSAV